MTLVSLDDEFEEYEALSAEDQVKAVRTGLVVVDTNVVLNLYRYDGAAAEDLFTVLGLLGERLFVPHQVASEFWSHRRGVIVKRTEEINEIIKTLDELAGRVGETLNGWRRRTGAGDDDVIALRENVEGAIREAKAKITERAEATTHHVPTADDEVLKRLRSVFSGKVGRAATPEQRTADISEGLRRFEKKIPPGFGDTKKVGDARAGDYVVWIQALRESKLRTLPYLVVVTEDSEKGDWFETVSGQTIGANLDLTREARLFADTRLLLIRTGRLLDLARGALGAIVAQESITSIENVSSRAGTWTGSDIEKFMDRLTSYSTLHALVVQEAAEQGGTISRARVYELGQFDGDRTLKGFTRPTRTVMRQLHDEGALSSDSLPEPLVSLYQSPDSYVLASHFGVPEEFVTWFLSEDLS